MRRGCEKVISLNFGFGGRFVRGFCFFEIPLYIWFAVAIGLEYMFTL